MQLYRAVRYAQVACNHLVALAIGEQAQDLPLPGCKIIYVGGNRCGSRFITAQCPGQHHGQFIGYDSLPGHDIHQRTNQVIRLHIFQQISLSTTLQCFDHISFIPAGGKDHDGHGLLPALQFMQHLQPRHLRHTHVQQYHIRLFIHHLLDTLGAITQCSHHFDAPAL